MSKFAILYPAAGPEDLLREGLERLKQQSHRDWVCQVVDLTESQETGKKLVAEAADERVKLCPERLDTLARMINWAMGHNSAGYVTVLPPGVLLRPEALARFAEEFSNRPQAACLYSCYSERKPDGTTVFNQLYPHEGAVHERFDFGYVKIYREARLKEIGGFDESLVHAAEYDVDLKLTDAHTLELVDADLYEVVLPPSDAGADTAPKALYSPGKGKLGGFSYVFYPPDLEAEITSVFEKMLRRRGAWIDHDTVPVPYPERPYRVKASVVIPILNRKRFIGNAIERVLEGTFSDFEIIVVDNGSTDGTIEEVRKYVDKDARVKLVVQKGPSIAYALNTGIRMAAGKYICQLDSDDEYTPDTLEKMVGHMETHPKCGLAISYYELMEEDRSRVEGVAPVTHAGYSRNQILRRDGAGALRVFPKVVLEEMGYYDEENFGNFGEDYDMVLKVGEKYDVDRVHHVLYRYRRHPDNTDVTRDPLMKVRNKNNARLNALRRRIEINKRLGKI
ncbi:MAG: glycosyltransferase [Candidatus Sumerlaeaceae bacterium]|nr:glycosyltransferase [Candidatus Sumerlaeaceae bacterium]